jgi:hypothetical protein
MGNLLAETTASYGIPQSIVGCTAVGEFVSALEMVILNRLGLWSWARENVPLTGSGIEERRALVCKLWRFYISLSLDEIVWSSGKNIYL